MKAFIVDADYSIIENKTIVRIFGRLENGQSFVSMHNFQPYFFIKSSDFKKAEKYLPKFKVEKTSLKDFKGNSVVKILHDNHTETNKLYASLHHLNIDTYEADIKPHQRFLIDNNIFASMEIDGDYKSSEKIDRVYHNPKIKSTDYTPELKILSIDTESDGRGNLYCIGLYAKNYKKNLIIGKEKLNNAINCENEMDCLIKFKTEIEKLDPDIITGWNLIDFDLALLQEVFKRNKLQFDIGRTNDNLRLRLESSYMKSSSASAPGRQIIDGLSFIQDPFIKEAPSIKKAEFESYSLEDVAQEILGRGKLIKGKHRCFEIQELYKNDKQKLIDYNLLDCQLVYEILEKTKMIELAIERCQLTGLQLDKITASIAAFDSLYIREARNSGLVSPTTRYQQKESKIIGGFVKIPESGIHSNVIVLDFKSLYPSIIKTFNIDPSSFLEHRENNLIESPNKAYFKNTDGILPKIIEKLHQAREKAKKEKRELSNYAIKIIMNSFYGVLASPNSRYFNFNMASAITSFAQMIIKMTASKIESSFDKKVIYSDTDSVFVVSELSKEKANNLGKEIEENINNFYKEYIKEKYSRQSYLELQFAKLYLSLMFPQLRMQKGEETKAAKKRYAGLIEKNGKEELEIIGLEAIRGDWTEAAKEFQKELLMKVFHKEPINSFIKSYVEKLKSGKLNDKLIYHKSLRKNLDEYTKTTPPHVKAARQLESLDSNIIEYVVTIKGPEPIQKLRHEIDYEHYINKQITPIANQILSLLGTNIKEANSKTKQSKLF